MFFFPRRLFRNHFIDSATETPDVCKSSVTSLFHHLRRHPIRRAAKALRSLLSLLNDFFTAPEVGQLANSIISNEDIGGFDITVHYIVVVKVFEAEQNLLGVFRDDFFIDIELLIVCLERSVSHILEEHV